MIFLKTSPFLGFLALLIHQPIVATLSLQQRDGEALPLQKRRADKTYWLHPTCTSLGGGQFKQAIKEAIWVASRIPENLNAFDSQLANPGRAALLLLLKELEPILIGCSKRAIISMGMIT